MRIVIAVEAIEILILIAISTAIVSIIVAMIEPERHSLHSMIIHVIA